MFSQKLNHTLMSYLERSFTMTIELLSMWCKSYDITSSNYLKVEFKVQKPH